jgi:hypothetical protein
MSSIRYGNLIVELVDEHGARLSRLSPLDAAPPLAPRPLPAAGPAASLLGRDQLVADAFAAIRARRPIEFFATCGYGKTDLLRHIAASARQQGSTGPGVYLRAGPDQVEDILHGLVGELYASDPPVKLTPGQNRQLLSQSRVLAALDDVLLGPEAAAELVRALDGCTVVLGSPQPVLGRNGTSYALPGLADVPALELLTRELGRPLADGEQAAARRLVTAVDGQPLHLRQAAALVREDGRPLAEVAEIARRDPEELDRLNISRLAVPERRALAVLALAAAVLLPASLAGSMADVLTIWQALAALRRRGLAEERAGRFGLPVCKVTSYRQLLLSDLQLASAAGAVVDWLRGRDPASADAQSAADGALAIIEWAAERGDWLTVIRLVAVAEPVLTLAGRWSAVQHVLDRGLDAARAAGDHAARALFCHEQGTLAFCLDDLPAAEQLLNEALRWREAFGDTAGAAVTRDNLRLLRPEPPPPPPPPPGDGPGSGQRPSPRTLLAAAAAAVGVLAVAITAVAVAGGGSHGSQVAQSPSPSVVVTTMPSTGASTAPPSSASTAPSSGASSTTSSSASTMPSLQPLTASASAENFGATHLNPASAPGATLTFTNHNDQPLLVTGPTIAGAQLGAFSVPAAQDMCADVTLLPGTSCTLQVQFAPAILGGNTATLTVASAGGSSPAVTLSGPGFIVLTLGVDGPGTITVTPEKFTCTTLSCPTEMIETSPITLTESSSPRAFKQWTGGACSGGDTTCTLMPTGDTMVTAVF